MFHRSRRWSSRNWKEIRCSPSGYHRDFHRKLRQRIVSRTLYSGWRFSRPCSGLRKCDTTRGNGVALLDYPESDRLEDDFYRPDDPSTVAGKRQRIADNKSRRAASIAADASDDEAPFLRSRRRVPVRKSLIPQSLLGRIALGTGVVLVLGVAATTV